MPLQQRQAQIVWLGDLKGNGTITVGSGALPELPVSFSARTENAGGKTSPEELIAAAHATCFAMSLSNTLGKAGTPPERLEVKATCALDRVEGKLKITTMDLDVKGRVPGIDQAKFEAAAKEAGQGCPVSQALKNNVEIRVHAQWS
jgi:lipoyl-dependent peroxiredoxin